MSTTMATVSEQSLLDKLDSVAPLAKLDAFPKIPSTYKARSESRGFMTLFVALLAVLLVLNDIGEYIWGWPDYEFSVDTNKDPYLNINLDMVVAMPCGFLSVDLRDAMGDRLFLTGGFRRDGTFFDVGQATALKAHSAALSARQAVAQSRKSRGLLSWLFSRKSNDLFKPSYKYTGASSACRITGTLAVKRVTANLHITTLGHGYSSYQHVDHNQMNLSHIITEFSFGPYFPDIVQPLDNSYESTDEHFIAYTYFLHVVPTTYIAPRSAPLRTHQYAVTHYTRKVEHDRGTPGIFFKFDLDPLSITLHQRTTTFLQLLIRLVGVIGGVFVCMGYAIRITTRAVEVVTGADNAPGIVAAEASGVRIGRRGKWSGGELRSRPKSGRLVPQGNGWTMEGAPGSPAPGSPYASYIGSPATPSGMSPYSAQASLPGSPALGSFGPPPTPGARSVSAGLGIPPPRTPGSSSFGPMRSVSQGTGAAAGSDGHGNANGVSAYGNGHTSVNGGGAYTPSPVLSDLGLPPASPMLGGGNAPLTPGAGYAAFPPSPAPGSAGVHMAPPPPKRSAKKDD